MATYYCSNWGNDSNDGSSWEKAKRTIAGIMATIPAGNIIKIKGFYNEQTALTTSYTWDGGNETIFDGSFLSLGAPLVGGIIENLTLQNWKTGIITGANSDINIINRNPTALSTTNFRAQTNCIIISTLGYGLQDNTETRLRNSNTYYSKTNTSVLLMNSVGVIKKFLNFYDNIVANWYVDCRISKIGEYCLFLNCAFKFSGGGLGHDEVSYIYPTGVTDTIKLQDLRNRMTIVYGGVWSDYLIGCKYYSGPDTDIFVDPLTEDFHLIPYCLPAHMSFSGDYIGAMPEAIKANWDSDFTGITNIDTMGNITDQTIDANASSNIMDIGHIRKIKDINALGYRAFRNGNRVNTESDLGVEITGGTNVFTAGHVYMCFNNTVTIDNGISTTLNPYQTYYAVNEGGGVGLGFSGVGTMKEVLISKYDEKIQMKFHKTDTTLALANLITCYLHRTTDYLYVNVDITGNPLYGDADTNYSGGTAQILSTRYWQVFPDIKANNMPAR